jgi:hypothetical protein
VGLVGVAGEWFPCDVSGKTGFRWAWAGVWGPCHGERKDDKWGLIF